MKHLEHPGVAWREDGDVFFKNARRRLEPSWPLSHTHVCARNKCVMLGGPRKLRKMFVRRSVLSTTNADQPRIYHSERENSGQNSSSFRSSIGTPTPVLHTRPRETHSSALTGEKVKKAKKEILRNFTKTEFSWKCMQIERFKENKKLYLSSLKQNLHRRILLQEQRKEILSKTRHELL